MRRSVCCMSGPRARVSFAQLVRAWRGRRRTLPALLEELLPVLRPRPAEKIDVAFVERRQLRRPAIGPEHDAVLDAALDEAVAPLRRVDRARARPRRHDAKR